MISLGSRLSRKLTPDKRSPEHFRLGTTPAGSRLCDARDRLVEDQTIGDARWIAFLDHFAASQTWEIRSACADLSSPRRNSRAPKIAAHRLVDSDYSIWIDGNTRLLRSPEELVETYLANHDIAVFQHPVRDCLYEEVRACIEKGLGDPDLLQQQADAYRRAGLPPRGGSSVCA